MGEAVGIIEVFGVDFYNITYSGDFAVFVQAVNIDWTYAAICARDCGERYA